MYIRSIFFLSHTLSLNIYVFIFKIYQQIFLFVQKTPNIFKNTIKFKVCSENLFYVSHFYTDILILKYFRIYFNFIKTYQIFKNGVQIRLNQKIHNIFYAFYEFYRLYF